MVMFGDSADPLGLHGNAVLRLDTWLIGENHLYRGEGFPFDPEGLLSTFPSIVNVVAGYFVGALYSKERKHFRRACKTIYDGVPVIHNCLLVELWISYQQKNMDEHFCITHSRSRLYDTCVHYLFC
jgi:predicted acyltransferase